MSRLLVISIVINVACGSRAMPPPSEPGPDQSLADAMRLVCDAPSRADADPGDGSRSDKIAGHLTDGIGNTDVLTTVEAWKTDGINREELAALVARAQLSECKLGTAAP